MEALSVHAIGLGGEVTDNTAKGLFGLRYFSRRQPARELPLLPLTHRPALYQRRQANGRRRSS
jgi:hypothetical protein